MKPNKRILSDAAWLTATLLVVFVVTGTLFYVNRHRQRERRAALAREFVELFLTLDRSHSASAGRARMAALTTPELSYQVEQFAARMAPLSEMLGPRSEVKFLNDRWLDDRTLDLTVDRAVRISAAPERAPEVQKLTYRVEFVRRDDWKVSGVRAVPVVGEK